MEVKSKPLRWAGHEARMKEKLLWNYSDEILLERTT